MAVGMCGMTSSSSSVVEASVWFVGLIIDAAEDAGSTDATLERIEGIEALDSLRKGHRGGDSGRTGLERSLDGRGVMSLSETRWAAKELFSFSSVVLVLERGDRVFVVSELLRSLPLPSTVFLRDPFLFLDLCCTLAIAVPLPDVRSSSAPS